MKSSLLLAGVICSVLLLNACAGGTTASTTTTTASPSITTTQTQLAATVATAGTAYNFSFGASGGLWPLTWSETGNLPPGLLFNAGVLSGIPTAANSFTITVTVTDHSVPPQVDSRPFTILINAPPQLLITTPPPLPAGTAGVAYSSQISATGGVQPYSFSLTASSNPLPPGLAISSNANQGTILGIPTVAGTTNNIVIQVADAQSPRRRLRRSTVSISNLPCHLASSRHRHYRQLVSASSTTL